MKADSAKFMAQMDAVTSNAGPPSSLAQMHSGEQSAHVLDAWKASIDARAAEEKKRQEHIKKVLEAPMAAPSFIQEGEMLQDSADDDLGDGLESRIDELDQK